MDNEVPDANRELRNLYCWGQLNENNEVIVPLR